jgi:hypothetical protein
MMWGTIRFVLPLNERLEESRVQALDLRHDSDHIFSGGHVLDPDGACTASKE